MVVYVLSMEIDTRKAVLFIIENNLVQPQDYNNVGRLYAIV